MHDPSETTSQTADDAGPRAAQAEADVQAQAAEQRRAELFLMLHAQNQHRLSAFVHTLVTDWQDAEEIVQETLLLLWRKFDEFDASTSFFAWASRVAQYEVLNYRRKAARRRLVLDDDVLEAVAAAAVAQTDQVDLRREALESCVKKLSEQDREVLSLRYAEGASVHTAACALQRTTGHVHRMLGKIRHKLLDCIELRLSERGA